MVALARNQFTWSDLVGHQRSFDPEDSKVGMLLFTEAHLEYNAGLVISMGSTSRPSPVTATSTPTSLAEELEDYRQQLLAMATPPECPTDTSQGGSLFTPLVGAPMETSLDLAVVWALCGLYTCAINFGRCRVVCTRAAQSRTLRLSSGLSVPIQGL